MNNGNFDIDPRGLIHEAYRIEAITGPDCRTIFLDWALGLPMDAAEDAAIMALLERYGSDHPDHPMTAVLREGLGPRTARRRRRRRKG